MSDNQHGITIDLDALYNPVYLAVGKEISAFSSLESQLAILFALLMRPAEIRTSLIAFDEIRLTSPKIRVLQAVAAKTLNQEDLRYLSKICKRVEARAEFRIKLAHWVVSIWHPDGMPVETFDARIDAALVPPYFSQKNLSFDASEVVTVGQIAEFTKKCIEITTDLVGLNLRMQSIE